MNNDQQSNFMVWEKRLLRGYLVVITVSFSLLLVILSIRNRIEDLADEISGLLVLLLFVPMIQFILAAIRIIKFLVSIRPTDDSARIWRSIVIFFTSPVATAIYLFLLFAVLLSFTSCTYTG